MIRILTQKRLDRLLKRAYPKGLNLRLDFEARNGPKGGIFAGYDMDRDITEIQRKKAGSTMIEEVKKILIGNKDIIINALVNGNYLTQVKMCLVLAQQIDQLCEPKPDEDRLLTDEDIKIEWFKAIAKYDKLMPNSLNDYERELWGKIAIVKAQRDLTVSIIRAECQARLDKLMASYTIYIEARKSDLTGIACRSIPHSMALQVRRDTLDFALKAFIELASK